MSTHLSPQALPRQAFGRDVRPATLFLSLNIEEA